MNKRITALVVVGVVAVCAGISVGVYFGVRKTGRSELILEGDEVSSAEYPYNIVIYDHEGTLLCGGTLFAVSLVLTGAHCFYNPQNGERRAGPFYVGGGNNNYSHNRNGLGWEEEAEVQAVVVHPRYNEPQTGDNDIALLVLHHLAFSQSISNVMLPGPEAVPNFNETSIDSGWIMSEEGILELPKIRRAQVLIQGTSICRQGLRGSVAGKLCTAPSPGKRIDTSRRGSAGPLVCSHRDDPHKMYICGIVSPADPIRHRRSNIGDQEQLIYYTDVSYYMEWIRSQVQIYRSPFNCPLGYFTCHNLFCISGNFKCDGHDDCGDGSDEVCRQGEPPSTGRSTNIIFQGIVQVVDINSGGICSGFKLAPKFILTPAHCFFHANGTRKRESFFVIWRDALSQGRNTQEVVKYRVPVQDVVIHEWYSVTGQANYKDIALVVLADELNMESFDKVGLSDFNAVQSFMAQAMVAQYLIEDDLTSSRSLQTTTEVELLDFKSCSNYGSNTAGKICTKRGNSSNELQSFCNDALSGFLICFDKSERERKYICGIGTKPVDAGGSEAPCGGSTSPGTYTDVSYYRDWITEQLLKFGATSPCYLGNYQCRNSICIPKGYECDGYDDCGDMSDEGDVCFQDSDHQNLRETEIQRNKLLRSPKATLFTSKGFQGSSRNYDFEDPTYEGGCTDVDIGGPWKSVDPKGSCVRIFQDRYCLGLSFAVYPGNSAQEIPSELSKVWSIGPCLKTEFDFSTFTPATNELLLAKGGSNIEVIPDLVDISGEQLYDQVTDIYISSSGISVRRYLQEENLRVKYLYAEIQKVHLLKSFPTFKKLDSSEHWMKIDKRIGDGLGLIIPPALSGPSNETFNAFPQSRANAREWKRVTDQIPGIFKQYPESYVEVRVTLSYENESTTRPFGFYYHMIFGNKKVLYGFIRN